MRKKISSKYSKRLETEFLSEALEIIEKPASPLGHFAIWITIVIVISFLIWAFIGKMDEVAIASAKVIPKDGVKVIQPLYEGVITDIFVEEGDIVVKNQELILLDTTIDQYGMNNVEDKLAELDFQNILLEMLLEDNDITDYLETHSISKGTELKVYEMICSLHSEHLSVINQFELQYDQCKKQEEIEQKALDKLLTSLSQLKSQKDELTGLYDGTLEAVTLEGYYLQLSVLEEELGDLIELYDLGAVARTDLEQKENEIEIIKKQIELQEIKSDYSSANNSFEIRNIDEQISLINVDISTQETLVKKQVDMKYQIEASIETARIEYSQRLISMIVDNNKQIQDLKLEHQVKHDYQNSQLLTSPVDGIIQTISVNTIGGVVTSAQPVISVVPSDAELIVEAQVLNKDIGFIRIGQEASIKLDTFSFQKYGTISGKIIYISPTAVENDYLGLVYNIKISIDLEEFHVDEKGIQVSSGMSGSAEIKISERRIIEFFLEPIFEYFDTSLKVR